MLLGLPWLFFMDTVLNIRQGSITIGDTSKGESRIVIQGPKFAPMKEQGLILVSERFSHGVGFDTARCSRQISFHIKVARFYKKKLDRLGHWKVNSLRPPKYMGTEIWVHGIVRGFITTRQSSTPKTPIGARSLSTRLKSSSQNVQSKPATP